MTARKTRFAASGLSIDEQGAAHAADHQLRGTTINGPIYLVLDGLTNGVMLQNASGVSKTHVTTGDPFIILEAWGLPVILLVSFFLFVVESIVEEPFGRERDDLDLDRYCRTIRESVDAVLPRNSGPGRAGPR